MSDDTPQTPWCVRPGDHDEAATGPFETREAAIADARAMGWPHCFVSRIVWIRPARYAPDIERILERMDESALDDVHFDDALFSVVDRAAAEADLEAWVRKHVRAEMQWHSGGEEERVELTTRGGE